MYRILKYWFSPVCKYLGQTDQFANLPRSTCPNRSNIKYLHETHQCASGMCYKRGFLQLVCVHLCCWREIHFEDSLLPPGLICCRDAITALRSKNNCYCCCFRVSHYCKYPLILYTEHVRICYWTITRIYRAFPV